MAADAQAVKDYIGQANLCEHIDEEVLTKMGMDICDWFDDDELSRQDWKDRADQALKLATQVIEKKNFPWPNAANVKYPLITTAAMQFAARAYPALVPGPNLVQGLVIGRDEGGLKQQSAERVGRHMSYQLLFEMENWEEDMDRLCFILPIIGCMFKKTYFDPLKEKNVSDLIFPQDLVIDYYAKTMETATRKSHIVWKTKNEILERVRQGLYCDVELPEPVTGTNKTHTRDQVNGTREPKVSPATPHKLIECHTFWDLDEDGYAEPYIITVHYESKQVLRVVARFTPEGIQEDNKGKIIKITPMEMFTKFPFIPNPDGGIYDVGFGLLLGGINETINTTTNQLLDAGTLNNLQGGLFGRGIRMRSGATTFSPGEWKNVDFTGDDIKKHIFPLPTKEPSVVLFQLLEALVTSGKELASVAEIFVGKMPGQNTPATTTMATIEQGLKVFTAIHKRIYRALGKEYEKLFRLNSENLDEKVFFTINEAQGPTSQEVGKADYAPENLAVKPFADPNIVSSAQKLMKVQSYGALIELQTINPQEYTKRYLEAVEADNISALMNVQPKPDPEMAKAQMEMQQSQQEHQSKMELEKLKLQIKMMEMQMKEQEMRMNLQFKQMEMHLKGQEAQMDHQIAQTQGQMELQQSAAQHEQTMEQSSQEHEQSMQLSKETHALKQKQLKEQAANGPSGTSNKGGTRSVAKSQGNKGASSKSDK